jgi:hypothetical protein
VVRRTYRRPFWHIARQEASYMEVLTAELPSGEEALPVFSFEEEEARMFLESGVPGGGWRVRQTTAGELASVLFGSGAGVRRVMLDPLPLPFPGQLAELLSMGRETFVRTYLDGEGVRPSVARLRYRRRARAASFAGEAGRERPSVLPGERRGGG